MQKQNDSIGGTRKSLIGSGGRESKIRTYNFPQDRLTDHRIGLTVHNLPNILGGEIQTIIDTLVSADQAEKLTYETEA
jgi:peptide chain release factor 1